MDGSQALAAVREDRHPWETYDDILNRDTRPVPPQLREGPTPDLGTAPVAASRYYDRAFFDLEVQHVWMKVWQWACREEHIPNVGDTHIYDVVGRSLLIVRTAPDQIKAFHNSCPHRGRKLATLPGCKTELRCPYHGLAWHTDGTPKDNHLDWDFPQWRDAPMNLPEARVATWGGFVFVNFDPEAPPLLEQIAPLAEHFERYDYPDRYVVAHVQKPVRCNWKALAEAFMESHHSITTHPHILPFLADVNSQYDLLNDYVSRQFSASGVSSPLVADKNYSAGEILDAMWGTSSRRRSGGTSEPVPDGVTARAHAAEVTRRSLSEEDGFDYGDKSDAEMVDSMLYNVWPNMSFWAGFAPNLVYRWRPYGLEPEVGLMEVLIMKRAPKDGPRPAPALVNELGIDERWSNATELGDGLATIFEQDMGNLPYVQEGLRASGTGLVHFTRYTEMRIRKLHQMIDGYIAAGTSTAERA
jgi:nitrite reductase/ring-hydroxylating ferredoxin subunit